MSLKFTYKWLISLTLSVVILLWPLSSRHSPSLDFPEPETPKPESSQITETASSYVFDPTMLRFFSSAPKAKPKITPQKPAEIKSPPIKSGRFSIIGRTSQSETGQFFYIKDQNGGSILKIALNSTTNGYLFYEQAGVFYMKNIQTNEVYKL